MNYEKLYDFLNKGGLLAGAIIFCTFAYRDMSRMQTDIDTLQAVVIDCYKERVQDATMRSSLVMPEYPEYEKIYAILPNNPVGKIKKNEAL